ncbi:M4 family metallopeptidase [Pseudoalteromonas sp. S16_S37]|uniref:M4 family metallopeptidase n=1 Tax=Pseudoalteromonas sp. S16_S37 TaxID=2720228 RepID=UPI001680536F|nr:M4 family metallopeptidase [Pseudoalteromonas sp. S16_S37]MBD1584452.1 PKD domain-containing protein [Pseudoalteromonas sp. S16_S37]
MKNKINKHQYLLALLAFSTSSVCAAERVDASAFYAALKQNQSVYTASDANVQTLLRDAQTLRQVSLPSGITKMRKQQYYQGLPLLGESFVVGLKNYDIYSLYGDVITHISDDITSTVPKITAQVAIRKALENTQLSRSAVQNTTQKLHVWLDDSNKAHLVWLVSFYSDVVVPTRPYFIIDAHSGHILKQWEGLTHASVPIKASGPGGNGKTGLYYYGAEGGLAKFDAIERQGTCYLDSANVTTYDMRNTTGELYLHEFACSENTAREVNGAFSPLNDAHAFAQLTDKMFTRWANTAALNSKIKLRVHYGQNRASAFWNGEFVTLGDGTQKKNPSATLSVTSHEIAHGFTEQHSQLIYSGQSGGLNEAYSDITAAALNQFVHQQFNWQIGDKLLKEPGTVRSMDNPKMSHTSQYVEGTGVHTSSGIFNKAFYVLATTTDWNIQKAFKLVTLANQLYWRSDATFESAGQGLYQAAMDLKYCVNDVVLAMESVGVYDSGVKNDSDCQNPDNDAGPTALFTYNKAQLQVSFIDRSSDDNGIASYYWDFGDGQSSTLASPTHTYQHPGSYQVRLTVMDSKNTLDHTLQTIQVVSDSCHVAAWRSDQIYRYPDKAAYNNLVYRAQWWTKGNRPDLHSGSGKVWRYVEPCLVSSTDM